MHPEDPPDKSDPDNDIDFVSKTELKRLAQNATELGKQLVKLNKVTLAKLDLDEKLLDNVLMTQSIKSNVARKRQLQFLGKLIRKADIELVEQQLSKLTRQHHHDAAQFHKLENWRDTLIKDGDAAINSFIDDYPAADRQQLRQLVRKAQQETKKELPPAAARKLFRYIKELNNT